MDTEFYFLRNARDWSFWRSPVTGPAYADVVAQRDALFVALGQTLSELDGSIPALRNAGWETTSKQAVVKKGHALMHSVGMC